MLFRSLPFGQSSWDVGLDDRSSSTKKSVILLFRFIISPGDKLVPLWFWSILDNIQSEVGWEASHGTDDVL